MHVPNRRWLASLILLPLAACASPEAEHKSEPPPSQPSAAPEAAQGDQAWLDKVKQDTAHIAAGQPAAKAQDAGHPAGQQQAAAEPQDLQAVMQQSREHL